MSTRQPCRSRIHLVLPALTTDQACVLHDLCADLMKALWNAHGDAMCIIEAEKASLENIGDPAELETYAVAENDDDLPPY